MKHKIDFKFVLFTGLLLGYFITNSVAHSQGDGLTRLTIHNNSDERVCNLFISPTGSEDWGEDRLSRWAEIEPGDSWSLSIEPGTYDFEFEDCFGNFISDELDVEISGKEYSIKVISWDDTWIGDALVGAILIPLIVVPLLMPVEVGLYQFIRTRNLHQALRSATRPRPLIFSGLVITGIILTYIMSSTTVASSYEDGQVIGEIFGVWWLAVCCPAVLPVTVWLAAFTITRSKFRANEIAYSRPVMALFAGGIAVILFMYIMGQL